MTDCQCQQSGWCERHGINKTAHWHHLCRTHKDYFEAWEEGRGPGQHARPEGLGDKVSKVLSVFGITKKRVGKVLRRPCNCGRRQELLNRAGRKVGIGR